MDQSKKSKIDHSVFQQKPGAEVASQTIIFDIFFNIILIVWNKVSLFLNTERIREYISNRTSPFFSTKQSETVSVMASLFNDTKPHK